MPEKTEVQKFTPSGNYAVIKFDERQFPGSVIPGDSLHILNSIAEKALEITKSLDNEELLDEINELQELIKIRHMKYKQVLDDNNIEYPWENPTNHP